MFNGRFHEAHTQSASLPTDDPEAFDLFIAWLYADTITPTASEDLGAFPSLFAFAEKYQITQLADNTMDAISQTLLNNKNYLTLENMERAYANTHAKSKLRLFCARSYAYTMASFDEEENWTTEEMIPTGPHSHELLADGLRIMRSFMKQKISPKYQKNYKDLAINPVRFPPCDYHQHKADEPCPNIRNKRKRED